MKHWMHGLGLATALLCGQAAAQTLPDPDEEVREARPWNPDEEFVETSYEPISPASPAELLRADPAAQEHEPFAFEGELRQRAVRVDPQTVRRLLAGPTGGFAPGGLTVELFPGEPWPLEATRWQRTDERSFTASGFVSGWPHAQWSMASRGGLVLFNLRPGDGTIHSLRTGPDGSSYASQSRPGANGRCGNELGNPVGAVLNHNHAFGEGPPEPLAAVTTLQLMVCMTPSAVDELGGGLAARLAVELAVEEGNQIFANSNIDAEWFLEAVVQVPYSEDSASHSDHLSRLQNPGDGFMDEVHEYRGVVHADFVSLIVDDTDTSSTGQTWGLGYVQPPPPLPWGGPWNTVHFNAMVTNMTLPHELGHNMGIRHDLAASGITGITDDAYGWLFTGSTEGALRTVMGTGGATRIPYYSDPNVFYDGQPTGQASGVFTAGADAASAIRLFMGTHALLGTSTLPTDTLGAVVTFLAGPFQTGAFNLPFDKLMEGVLQTQPSGGSVVVSGGGITEEQPLLWFKRTILPGSQEPEPFTVK